MTAVYGMLKAALVGQTETGREENDFYPTPPEATRALLPEIMDFPVDVWEPACGDGAIAKELIAAGHYVTATDLVQRGYGTSGVDFLQEWQRADAIVTNPPFGKLASAFIEHALALETPYIAMLVNVNFWHAKKYTPLFERRRPSAILPLTWRLDFTGSARPYFNCVWTVWRPRPEVLYDPVYRRLARPAASIEDLM